MIRSPKDFIILSVLSENPSGMGFNRLVEATEFNPKSLNVGLKRLIEEGCIRKREPCYYSGILSKYRITPKGRRLLPKLVPYGWTRNALGYFEELLLSEPDQKSQLTISVAPLKSGAQKLFIVYQPDRELNEKAVRLLHLSDETLRLLGSSWPDMQVPLKEATDVPKNLNEALNLLLRRFIESGGSRGFVDELRKLYQ